MCADKSNSIFKHLIKGYGVFLKQACLGILLCLFVVYVCYYGRNAGVVWGQGFFEKALGVVTNVFGIAGITGTKWFVDGWKLLGYFALLYLLVPIIGYALKINNRENKLVAKVVSVIAEHIVFVYMICTFIYMYWFENTDRLRLPVIRFTVIVIISVIISVMVDCVVNINSSRIVGFLYSKKIGVCILALIPLILSYVLAIFTSEMGYVNVDDGDMQYVLAGYMTGTPFPVHQYINVILSYGISFLYKICPSVQWWYVYAQAMIFVGMYLIHLCVLVFARRNNRDISLPLIIIGALDIGFLVYTIANVSFTTAPAVLGTGLACVLILCAGKGKGWKIVGSLSAVLGFVLIYIHRSSVGEVYICYLMMGYLYMLLVGVKAKKWITKVAVPFMIGGVILLALSGGLKNINSRIQSGWNSTEFNRFNYGRVRYMDYKHDTYDENSQIYEDVGWTREVSILADNWCFMPDEITGDNFLYISENSGHNSLTSKDVDESILSVPRGQAALLLGIVCIVILCILLFGCKDWVSILFAIFNNVGSLVLIAYQLIMGRILYRTIFIVILPAVVINCMLMLKVYPDKGIRRTTINLISVIAVLLCSVLVLEYNFEAGRRERVAWYREIETKTNDYVMQHDDNIYICTVKSVRNMGPWNVYVDKKPSNLIRWGGATFKSAYYNEQLRVNGLSELRGDVFKKDNVYFIISTNVKKGKKINDDSVFAAFYGYLKYRYGAIGFVKTDSIDDDAFIYHFVFDDNKNNYKKYYDIRDGSVVVVK